MLGARFKQRGIGTDEAVRLGVKNLDGIERPVPAIAPGDKHLAFGQQGGRMTATGFSRSGDELPRAERGIVEFRRTSAIGIASGCQNVAVIEHRARVARASRIHPRSRNEDTLR